MGTRAPNMDASRHCLPLPQQQALLGKVEGWLFAPFQGKMRKEQNTTSMTDQKNRGLWLAGVWDADLGHIQESPNLIHVPVLRQGVENLASHSQASKKGGLQIDACEQTPIPAPPRGLQDEVYRTREGTRKPQGGGHVKQGEKLGSLGTT